MNADNKSSSDGAERALFVIAFVSGASSLIYELVWSRELISVYGLSIYSTSATICVFILGMGCESRLASRALSAWHRSPLELYGCVEFAIGGSALVMEHLHPFVTAYSQLSLDVPFVCIIISRLLSAVLLIGPSSLLIGFTFPILLEVWSSSTRSTLRLFDDVTLLYVLNTVGGASGSLLAGFYLIDRFGLRKTIAMAATINFSVGLFCLAARASKIGRFKLTPSLFQKKQPRRVHMVLAFFAGLISFAFEIILFRVLVFHLQSTAYSLAIIFTCFFVGLAIGGMFVSLGLSAKTKSRSGQVNSFAVMGICWILVGIFGFALLPLFFYADELWKMTLLVNQNMSFATILFDKVFVAAAFILPGSLAMGALFPLLLESAQSSDETVSASAAKLSFYNSLGAVAGVCLTTYIAFERLGLKNTILAYSCLASLLGLGLVARNLRPSSRLSMIAFGT